MESKMMTLTDDFDVATATKKNNNNNKQTKNISLAHLDVLSLLYNKEACYSIAVYHHRYYI